MRDNEEPTSDLRLPTPDSIVTYHVSRFTRHVALTALAGYLLIFLLFLHHFGDLRDFILVGKQFITQSNISPNIRVDPTYNYDKNGVGYDGQFAYFIALDPTNARYYVDRGFVGYRYTRILYPIAARVMALGRPDWVPLTLILVNLLAVTLGTWAIAAWCMGHSLSPWLALVYAFYVGQVMAFTRDLNEILAYALVAVAVYLFDRWPKHRLWAGAIFGLSALGREQTLVFPALYSAKLFLEAGHGTQLARRLGMVLPFALFSIMPATLWQGCLILWLGTNGWWWGGGMFQVPLSGLYTMYPLGSGTLEVAQVVIVPGLVCLGATTWAIWKNREARSRVELWLLAVNTVLFVLLLIPGSLIELFGAARVTTPVVMAAIYSQPYVRARGWFYFCAGLWLTSTIAYVLNPTLELFHGH